MTREGRFLTMLRIVAVLVLLPCGIFAGTGRPASAFAPAEMPPAGFAAAQYIDSAGCVFVRDQTGWTARVGRDGQAICGYPPTLSARRTAPDTVTELRQSPPEPRVDRVTRELVTTVMTGLQTGELAGAAPAPPVSDFLPRPNHAAADVSPQANAAVGQLPDMIATAPALRQAVARTAGSARLCNLLGAGGSDAAIMGGAAMGACGALTDLSLGDGRDRTAQETPAGARVAGEPDATASRPAAPRLARPTSDRRPRDGKPARNHANANVDTRQVHGGRTSMAPADAGEPRIPAGARYIQVGVFANDSTAQQAARRLSALGLPVARVRMARNGRDLQIIMAGPFDGRQSLVRALHRVRDGGFTSAFPR